jgi:ABC-2 type transport system ATP-binding protein
MGFIFPEEGTIRLGPQRVLISDFKYKIGYLPERPYYYEFLTAQEYLYFHWNLSFKRENEKASSVKKIAFHSISEVLKKVNLQNIQNKKLRSFSKGMLQRVGLAQALLMNPDLLILDEPMSGLDPDGRDLVKSLLRQEKEKGKTILFSSHLLSDIDELCDTVFEIKDGICLQTKGTK